MTSTSDSRPQLMCLAYQYIRGRFKAFVTSHALHFVHLDTATRRGHNLKSASGAVFSLRILVLSFLARKPRSPKCHVFPLDPFCR
jgi:hypothetical protein